MSKITDKVKSITTGIVEKYALIQLDAKEKRDKKIAEIKRRRDMDESFYCPKCLLKYSGSQYYTHKTKKKDVKISREHGVTYINFFKCSCGEFMGIKTSYYHGAGLLRNSFELKDKNEI